MKIRKTIILGCLTMFCLCTAVSIYSGSHGQFDRLVRELDLQRSRSSLEQKQLMLATDIRHLRHALRHGASQTTISAEREAIRKDWLDIVTDRGLAREKVPPALLDLARAVHGLKRFD